MSRWADVVCDSRRVLSIAITFSIASLAPLKCFFSNPRITCSVSSVIRLSVSIFCLFFTNCYFAAKLNKIRRTNTYCRYKFD